MRRPAKPPHHAVSAFNIAYYDTRCNPLCQPYLAIWYVSSPRKPACLLRFRRRAFTRSREWLTRTRTECVAVLHSTMLLVYIADPHCRTRRISAPRMIGRGWAGGRTERTRDASRMAAWRDLGTCGVRSEGRNDTGADAPDGTSAPRLLRHSLRGLDRRSEPRSAEQVQVHCSRGVLGPLGPLRRRKLLALADEGEAGHDGCNGHETDTQGADKRLPRWRVERGASGARRHRHNKASCVPNMYSLGNVRVPAFMTPFPGAALGAFARAFARTTSGARGAGWSGAPRYGRPCRRVQCLAFCAIVEFSNVSEGG